METNISGIPPRSARIGWAILLGLSAVTLYGGVFWFFEGPELALSNITERLGLDMEAVRGQEDGAFVVITIVARTLSAYWTGLGLAALIVTWRGFRRGSRWAWLAAWGLVAGFALVALSWLLAAGASGVGLMYLGVAVAAAIGQVLAGRGLAD